MALQLTIIKFPPGIALAEDRKTFGPQGGLIGRGVDNDWVLSDPERFLSSKHCQISGESNRYFLTDLSTNGTFVNGSPEPVGRGSRIALNDGDCFDVGEYRFKVTLEQQADPFASSPFAAPSGFAGKDTFAADDFAFAKGEAPVPESMFMSGDYQGAIQDIAPESLKITDPLIALDNANKPSGGSSFKDSSPFADPFISVGSQPDAIDPLNEAIAWPESKQGGSMLPEDWADDISLIGGRKNKAAPYSLPDDDSLIKSAPQSKVEATPQSEKPTAKNLSESVPSPLQTGKKPATGPGTATPRPGGAQSAPPPAKQQPLKAAPAGAMDRTLLEALGLGDANLSDDQIREIHHTVGLMMRETIDGLMQVLRSRTSIKNEFRINITTIQPVENNPIKFSVSVDEVLDIMFVRKTRAYKAPLDAVQESFFSIADHQLAVIAGIRSAFRSAMSKFDPERLEEEFKQSGKGGLLPGVIKGRLWNAYQDHYQKMVNDMERSFQELFGDEFVQAYEDQMRKLASARKRDL
jgi:type VI secretion system FHA domain protein